MAQPGRFNIVNQIESLAQLPGQAIKTGIAGANALIGKQNLQARLNQLNPQYGNRPFGMPQYKKGGKVEKTGPAIVHKGERVLTVSQAEKFDKIAQNHIARGFMKR